MQAKLLITLNNTLVSEHSLEGEVTSIGRKSDSDIHIDNPAVSGKHARVLYIGGEAFLEDLESTNGTFVNSERITKHLLKNGDLISIGQHQLKFEGVAEEEGDLDKTLVIKPYAPGMEGTAAFEAAALEKEKQQKEAEARAADISDEERPALLQLLSGPNNGKKNGAHQIDYASRKTWRAGCCHRQASSGLFCYASWRQYASAHCKWR